MGKELITRVKGVKDILPAQSIRWLEVESLARLLFSTYNYQEIRLPVFEKTEVFARSIGETSDIVEKEMYTFQDRGGESLTLRPEGTASMVRAYVENSLYGRGGVQKYYYLGPMFRAERPQAGRFRQFHQIGAEVFGSDDPAVDAETILLLVTFLTGVGVGGLEVRLNSLGCPACRPSYRAALTAFLQTRLTRLCDNCRGRIGRNPLRALDCKSPSCQEAVKDAPVIGDHLCEGCRTHFGRVRALLESQQVAYALDPRLVRGLDYYTRTAFEVTSSRLGAQNAIAGGGRYNGLVEEFGGPPTSAIGFAVGIERLITLLEGGPDLEHAPDVFVVGAGESVLVDDKVFEVAQNLRVAGIFADRAFGGGKLKNQMKKADKSGAMVTVIVGDDELTKNVATVRIMKTGEQHSVPFDELAQWLSEFVNNEEQFEDDDFDG
ncbi:MAG: histidine--tRNA ligase [Nitrospinae bacterium]|nr:histidine--tRNA ligase [Nitrospinota bacterium]